MRSILIPTTLLILTIVILSLMFVLLEGEIENYDEQTGNAVRGDDFWQDYVKGEALENKTEDGQRRNKG